MKISDQEQNSFFNSSFKLAALSKTILVVDDDQAILEAIEMILELHGYHVLIDNGWGVEEKIEKHSPDLILLDVGLGEKNGTMICSSLKNNSKTKKIPIILISAHPDVENFAEKNKADNFIAKPFDIDDLLKKIEVLIKN